MLLPCQVAGNPAKLIRKLPRSAKAAGDSTGGGDSGAGGPNGRDSSGGGSSEAEAQQ